MSRIVAAEECSRDDWETRRRFGDMSSYWVIVWPRLNWRTSHDPARSAELP